MPSAQDRHLVDPESEGGYEDWTIGSVVGLAPVENPRYAILVKIDHPKDDIWGVRTAAAVYEAIVAQLLRYERIAPDPPGRPEQVAGVIRCGAQSSGGEQKQDGRSGRCTWSGSGYPSILYPRSSLVDCRLRLRGQPDLCARREPGFFARRRRC